MNEEPDMRPQDGQTGHTPAPQPEALVASAEQSAGPVPAVPEDAVRLAEALIFAGTEPVSLRRLAELLEARNLVPDGLEDMGAFVAAVMAALVARYDGRGVMPVEVAGGWQFRTAPDLAPALTRVLEKPRRLPRAVMETLAIIAYHQPCTRVEIEEIRGVSLGQTVLDTLIEASLVAPRGRKEVPGRPVLWGTTPDFLRHFGLRALSDLPRREELLVDVPDTLTSGRKSAQSAEEAMGQDGAQEADQEAGSAHSEEERAPEDDTLTEEVRADPDLTPAEDPVEDEAPAPRPESNEGAGVVSEPERS
ncbi:SMC-Scp complex subunit ScpB [Acetobacter farinalis]|nr:SMC-Scp complex subunit ScpB [Acetobacter farinalis]